MKQATLPPYAGPEDLVGATIRQAFMNDAKDRIVLDTDRFGLVSISAAGDCCSSSWFAHVSGSDALRGEILLADTVDLPDVYNPENGESGVDYAYALKIVTPHGTCTIEMRNDGGNGGYYGGWYGVSHLSDIENASTRPVEDQ